MSSGSAASVRGNNGGIVKANSFFKTTPSHLPPANISYGTSHTSPNKVWHHTYASKYIIAKLSFVISHIYSPFAQIQIFLIFSHFSRPCVYNFINLTQSTPPPRLHTYSYTLYIISLFTRFITQKCIFIQTPNYRTKSPQKD